MPPRLSDFGTGPQALKAYQAALAAYKVQQAQKKAAPQPAAQPAPQSTPQKSQVAQPAQQPLSTTPTQQTVQGVQPFAKPPVQQGATQQPGLDEQSLLKSGISQEQLYKAKSILSASQNLAASQSQRAEELKKFTQEDLKQGQQEVEGMYNNLKTQKQQLAAESEQVISETAEVQKDIASQEYQKNKFMNEQAQKQYEIDTQRAERKQEQANEEDETALRRAMAAQLGASFGSEGLVRITKSKQEGEEILADLRAKTAIGNAEFSFKAMEIESKYSTNLKEISNTRKSEILNVKKTLDDQLTAIDEKVLMSKEAKREAAREAVTNYYNQLNEIDTKSAQTTTQMVETLFKEKKDLEQEKEVREAIDLNVSSALGFFANKFGDPIGVREGEQPRPFTGQFNGALSQQFGYLVDEQGRAILASDGQKIKFKDFTKQEKQSALERLLSGNATGYDAAEVNGMTGNNAAIVAAAPEGSYGGQCGTFVRTRFTTEGGWEGKCAGLSGAAASACSMQVKKELVDSRGQRREDYAAKVGDILCFTGAGYGATGHYAIINSISEDGKTYTLTESNMDLKGTIHNTRKIQANNPAIYGGFTPQLKPQFANANPKNVEGSAASEGGETASVGINLQTVDILKKIQKNPAAYALLDATERVSLDTMAGGTENMQKILRGEDVATTLKSATKADIKLDKDAFDQEMKIRDDFTKGAGEFVKVRDAYNKITKASQQKNAAGDMGLIFAYMKILDPGSTVREGEYASAQNATNVPGWAINQYNAAKDGTKLNDTQRKQFVDLAKGIYDAQKVGYDKLVQETKSLASSYGLDPNRVTFQYENLDGTGTPQTQPAVVNVKDSIASARKMGMSSSKILDYLSEDAQFNNKIKKARSDQVSDDKILEYFNQ